MAAFPEGALLMEGVRLMVVGMSTVFAFLALLVGAMQVTAVAVARLAPPPPEPPAPPAGVDDGRIAVVLAAVAARHGVVR